MSKFMLKNIPSRAHDLWPYAIDYAIWLYNRLPQESLQNRSPYEIIHKQSADLSLCRLFGTECWYNENPNISINAIDKGFSGIYLGHSPISSGHLILTATNTVITCRIVKFATHTNDVNNKHLLFYRTEDK